LPLNPAPARQLLGAPPRVIALLEAGYLGRAGNAQALAQPRHRDLAMMVDDRHHRRPVPPVDRQGGRITLDRLHRETDPDTPRQGRRAASPPPPPTFAPR